MIIVNLKDKIILIAFLNDTHLGVRNSSDIFLNNAEKFYSEVFFPYCKEHDIKQIVHLGDYFDNRKMSNVKAINQNRRVFLSKLREYGIKMDIIPGNHDVFYKNTNDVNSLKEFLGHYMNEINIVMKPTVMKYGSLELALIPWINNENYESTINFIKNCKAPIMAGHFEFSGFEVQRGITQDTGLNHKLFEKYEAVFSGHYHVSSEKDNIIYFGTQMEFTWADAHDQKCFHVLDTETLQLDDIENPNTLHHKIVYNDEEMDYNDYNMEQFDGKFVKIVVVNKTDPLAFDSFIDRIEDRSIHDLKIAENFDEFIGSNIDDDNISVEDTHELLDSYIDVIDTNLDKNRLKLMMKNLLTEAQATEIS